MKGFKFISKNKINRLPQTAGVYAFKKSKELLYIGKAINIRSRVKQHFTQPRRLSNLIENVGYIETESEIEALLLEARLIKKYQPKYNTVWKDDKNYFYVAITKEQLPRIKIGHAMSNNKRTSHVQQYIGPFVNGRALKETLKTLRKVFPYYTLRPGSGQAQKHPKGLCPWCHLNLCPGPNPNKKEYQKNIKNLTAVLREYLKEFYLLPK